MSGESAEPMVWTDERIEQLKELWAEGLTTGEIGKRLGVSKNAVVGKAHRLGLKGRPSPIKRTKAPRQTPAAPKEKEQKIRSVVDLSAHTCRWPIGDPREPGFHFCGAPTIANKPYCAEHAAIAYVGASSPKSPPPRDEDAA
ncbi:GcrA cell cycle regulator [Insolitispirillum peregrinum]|uniref:GcrA cell cycle regulator n=2 Tax=Insolitispirillum peregrinum TaxID=80876 RepID=A0A1N7IVW3_9PROT|nr:GcrA cell cycle regulator [Insolitispirillum peregrinum]